MMNPLISVHNRMVGRGLLLGLVGGKGGKDVSSGINTLPA